MIDWLAVRATYEQVLFAAIPRAWTAGTVAVASYGPMLVVWSEGARARRPPRWPDVLSEWVEIYEERLFASDLAPVLAEEVSALGAEALAVCSEPGFARASVGWYEKAGLVGYEHVGSAQVAWTPDDGLGRPVDSSLGSMFAKKGRAGAALSTEAGGEILIGRAFLRLLGSDPGPIDQLAGYLVQAPTRRYTLA